MLIILLRWWYLNEVEPAHAYVLVLAVGGDAHILFCNMVGLGLVFSSLFLVFLSQRLAGFGTAFTLHVTD